MFKKQETFANPLAIPAGPENIFTQFEQWENLPHLITHHRFMDLVVYYQNTRGLRSKTNEFYTSTLSSTADIICLSETWLNDNIKDGELFDLRNFEVFRRNQNTTLGGQSNTAWSSDGICEDLWVSVSLGFNKNLTCAVYIFLLMQVNKILPPI
ncbi:hypothetical protein NQ317_010234 [Molorchus minor]|uniref:Uncharacterized protein n=1 Tax=Molorchus minor TaxID=1323400 RepID=A0ABQ9JHF9_9CUCU|nr:hypothetical protein NQ317_010234 [Molorchus minor]